MILSVGPTAAFLFFVPLWGPQLALRGLLPPVSDRAPASSYSLLDLLVLTTLLAIAFSLTRLIQQGTSTNWTLLGAASLFTALMWYKCIGFMSVNRITGRLARIITQFAIYPSAILSISYLVISASMLASGIIDALASSSRSPPDLYLIVLAGVFLASVAWIYLTRRLYCWISTHNANGDA